LTFGGNFGGRSGNQYYKRLLNPIRYNFYSVAGPSIEHFSEAARVAKHVQERPILQRDSPQLVEVWLGYPKISSQLTHENKGAGLNGLGLFSFVEYFV
jgi:hypothetical protein